jgi:large subunit ribosomal protein L9
MEVILNQDVKGLGYKYDIIKVKAGYGRNFLLPRGIAVLATESNKKVQAETLKQRSFKEEKLRTAATANAEKLSAVTLKIGAKAGESGKIFGSVSNIQVAEALKHAGYDVERKNIELTSEEGIKSLGNYSAKVRLYKEIVATINFEVVAE